MTAARGPVGRRRRPPAEELRVGGFEPFSTVDWPGLLAAVVFVQGCPWRCGYCHNPHLQRRDDPQARTWPGVERELRRRSGWLDGVIFSGGEPTGDRALVDAARRVRGLGHRVGLHTCGAYPDRLPELLPLLDWIGFDIKAPPGGYDALTGIPGSGPRAMRSAGIVAESGIDCEFRMTYHSGLLATDAVLDAADRLASLGVHGFVLQEYRRDGVSARLPPHEGVDAELLAQLGARFPDFTFRSAHGAGPSEPARRPAS